MSRGSDGSRIVRVTALLYRTLLRLWTRELRERFRDDAVELFRERVGSARRRGRLAALRVAARAFLDLGRDPAGAVIRPIHESGHQMPRWNGRGPHAAL